MISPQSQAHLIRSPWTEAFAEFIKAVQTDLLLVSPFVKSRSVDRIVSELQRRSIDKEVSVVFLTDLRPESTLNGSLDLEALVSLSKAIPHFELTHLPSLHAKVYVADEKLAVITSANLTEPGMSGNLEYGVAFTDARVVRQVRRDFEKYACLGARVLPSEVEVLFNETRELKLLFKKAEQSIRSQARRAFQEKLKATQIQLLRQRAKGKTTQAMHCDGILFLLARRPLRTAELQPLVQQLQPDLCDDSIDRVIDGVHFGKRWKHHVRSAQQFLKRTGRISYDGERWHLVK